MQQTDGVFNQNMDQCQKMGSHKNCSNILRGNSLGKIYNSIF